MVSSGVALVLCTIDIFLTRDIHFLVWNNIMGPDISA